MIALFILLVFIWTVATITSYLCLLMTLAARYFPGCDQSKVQHYLRSTYLCGYTALACVAISALLNTVDFLLLRHSFHTVTFEQWLDSVSSYYAMGPFAAINILPSSICWLWWRRCYGAAEN